jgi:hypothetical protein
MPHTEEVCYSHGRKAIVRITPHDDPPYLPLANTGGASGAKPPKAAPTRHGVSGAKLVRRSRTSESQRGSPTPLPVPYGAMSHMEESCASVAPDGNGESPRGSPIQFPLEIEEVCYCSQSLSDWGQ